MELWDDVAAGKDTSQAPGYCAHATTIFPTWHRPYLAMMEVGHTNTEADVNMLTDISKPSIARCSRLLRLFQTPKNTETQLKSFVCHFGTTFDLGETKLAFLV